MADPVSIAIKGAGTAFSICKATYDLVQGMKKAPEDIRRVAADMQGFYGVLGALSHSIEAHRSTLAAPGLAAYHLENISSLISDAVGAFQDVQSTVQSFIAVNGRLIESKWENFKWEVSEKGDVKETRLHLSNIKLTLNIALSTLILTIVSQTNQQVAATFGNVLIIQQDLQSLHSRLDFAQKSRVGYVTAHPPASRWSVTSVASLASLVSMEDSIHDFVVHTEHVVKSVNSQEAHCDENAPSEEQSNLPRAAEEASELGTADGPIWEDHIDDAEQMGQSADLTHGYDAQRRRYGFVSSMSPLVLPALGQDSGHTEATPRTQNDQSLTAILDIVKRQLGETWSQPKSNSTFAAGTTVDLSKQQLCTLPIEAISLMKNTVKMLALSHNRRLQVPTELMDLRKLIYVNIRWCRLKQFPEAVLRLSGLQHLELSHNSINAIPEQIEVMTSLAALAFKRNKISRLPLALGRMESLDELWPDDNPLVFPPLSVLRLGDEEWTLTGDQKSFIVCDLAQEFLRSAAQEDACGSAEKKESTQHDPIPCRQYSENVDLQADWERDDVSWG
ncbi:hypothetical protein LTR85_008897 [Meristemomyces frigidus]|nr:hypothetical protein LTR85_008897 [Meristemomyces frigidus]